MSKKRKPNKGQQNNKNSSCYNCLAMTFFIAQFSIFTAISLIQFFNDYKGFENIDFNISTVKTNNSITNVTNGNHLNYTLENFKHIYNNNQITIWSLIALGKCIKEIADHAIDAKNKYVNATTKK